VAAMAFAVVNNLQFARGKRLVQTDSDEIGNGYMLCHGAPLLPVTVFLSRASSISLHID
jgi:hypothetical protein